MESVRTINSSEPCAGATAASLLKLLTVQACDPTPQRARLIARLMQRLAGFGQVCPTLKRTASEMSEFWEDTADVTMPQARH